MWNHCEIWLCDLWIPPADLRSQSLSPCVGGDLCLLVQLFCVCRSQVVLIPWAEALQQGARKVAYPPRGRSRLLLETPFSEPLLRTLLRTPFVLSNPVSRPPSENPSENPSSEPFAEPSQNPSYTRVLPYDPLGVLPIQVDAGWSNQRPPVYASNWGPTSFRVICRFLMGLDIPCGDCTGNVQKQM